MASHATATDRSSSKAGLRIESFFFFALTVFFVVAAIVYWVLVPTEPVGIVALGLTGGMCVLIGTFLWFVSRRLEGPRPEDDVNAEVADGAGDMGFFSPGSYWPFTVAMAVSVFAVAFAYLLWWLMVIGLGFLLWSIWGLLFEYHRRPAHH